MSALLVNYIILNFKLAKWWVSESLISWGMPQLLAFKIRRLILMLPAPRMASALNIIKLNSKDIAVRDQKKDKSKTHTYRRALLFGINNPTNYFSLRNFRESSSLWLFQEALEFISEIYGITIRSSLIMIMMMIIIIIILSYKIIIIIEMIKFLLNI